MCLFNEYFKKICSAVYGQQEDIAKVFDFGSTNKNDMKCKLYGYDSEADCDLSVFKVCFRSISGETSDIVNMEKYNDFLSVSHYVTKLVYTKH